MADKSITDLNVVPGSIDDSNTWFAVAQSGTAYKVSGHEFILALTVILDGHGGISEITGPTTSGLVDTYTITYADETTTTFEVTNGKGITGISKTGTAGLVDTYTITYNDSTTSTFTVTNGAKGDTGDSWYVWIKYAGDEPTQDSDMGDTPDNWMGIYSGTSSTAPEHYTDYDWFQIKGAKGDTGNPATVASQSVTYQEGTSGSVAPSGTWTTTIPTVSQGNFLWTKTVVEFNTGSPITFYSVARMGVDGTGSVSSVNGQSPDGNGNVTVTATDIGTTDNTSIQTDLTNLKNSLNSKADEDSLALRRTGATNTGTQIENGTYFYLDGTLKHAIATIAQNASFTASNCETVTAGGLNAVQPRAVTNGNITANIIIVDITDASVDSVKRTVVLFNRGSGTQGFSYVATNTSNNMFSLTVKYTITDGTLSFSSCKRGQMGSSSVVDSTVPIINAIYEL